MKLTNLQLEILAKSVYQKVLDKINKIKESSVFLKKYAEISKKENLSEKLRYSEEDLIISNKINKLELKRQKLTNEYRDQFKIENNTSWYTIPEKSKHIVGVETKTINQLTSHLPTFNDVKSAIVLHSIQGSGDVIESILKKFKLD